MVSMSPLLMPDYSVYQSAKLAQVKSLEFLAAEEKGLNVLSVHPSTIDTGTFRNTGIDHKTLPMNTGKR